jgi:hypothetical protein
MARPRRGLAALPNLTSNFRALREHSGHERNAGESQNSRRRRSFESHTRGRQPCTQQQHSERVRHLAGGASIVSAPMRGRCRSRAGNARRSRLVAQKALETFEALCQRQTQVLDLPVSSMIAFVPAPPEQQDACRPDVRRFCHTLKDAEGDATFVECLKASRAKLSNRAAPCCKAMANSHGSLSTAEARASAAET